MAKDRYVLSEILMATICIQITEAAVVDVLHNEHIHGKNVQDYPEW